jgi:hypothetical protein
MASAVLKISIMFGLVVDLDKLGDEDSFHPERHFEQTALLLLL